jgi:hypothetical protein
MLRLKKYEKREKTIIIYKETIVDKNVDTKPSIGAQVLLAPQRERTARGLQREERRDNEKRAGRATKAIKAGCVGSDQTMSQVIK